MIGDSYKQDAHLLGDNYVHLTFPDPLKRHKPTEYSGLLSSLSEQVNVEYHVIKVFFAVDETGNVQMYNHL